MIIKIGKEQILELIKAHVPGKEKQEEAYKYYMDFCKGSSIVFEFDEKKLPIIKGDMKDFEEMLEWVLALVLLWILTSVFEAHPHIMASILNLMMIFCFPETKSVCGVEEPQSDTIIYEPEEEVKA